MRLLLLSILLIGALLLAIIRVERIPTPRFAGGTNQNTMVGVFHVHSDASHDSSLTRSEIASAAASLGLDFVWLTDHNVPTENSLESGVWLLGGNELSTEYGHLLTNDGQREWNVAAHPTAPANPWRGPPQNGIEIVNAASSARRRAGPWLVGALAPMLLWPFARDLALWELVDRDDSALALWDSGHASAFCGVDAHGWIDARSNFRLWQMVVEVIQRTPAHLHDGIKSSFCVSGLGEEIPRFEFLLQDSPRALVARVGHETPMHIALYRDGALISRTASFELVYREPRPGAYRIEVWAPVPTWYGGVRWLPILYSQRLWV